MFKKSCLALALATTLPTVSYADATLYGSFRLGMFKTDNKSAVLDDYASRIGVRGSVDLGLENTQGIFHWEQGLSLNTGALLSGGRYASVGAKGDWGTLLGGKIDHPTYAYVGSANEFAMSALPTGLDVGYVANGSKPQKGFRADRRIGNSLAYVTPNLQGFEAMVAGVFGGENPASSVLLGNSAQKDKTLDGYNLGVKYTWQDLTLATAYGAVKSKKDAAGVYQVDANLWGMAARYKWENFRFAAKYEQSKDKISGLNDKGIGLNAGYELNGFGGSIGYTTTKQETKDREKALAVELHRRMGKGVIALGYVDYNSAAVDPANSYDGTTERALTPMFGGNDTAYLTYRLQF
ncbi:porin [Nitrincola tapanii]|uniref:Porin n=1 Tax=Nitrincola tapanii TaxID=1708751 RepID=A0A5A9W5B4_9GAMM|nr:porin [Nitrincola tapanii]KAA0875634.1 porin [Nitrincola tapanii]